MIMDNYEIMVTIRCITFNHACYIRQCLEGFLMQKTSFKYEILIHDDASTDGTREIIEEYAYQYPDIIIPLYESENQYSKYGHLMVVRRLMDSKIRGKYTALCEGDDYWIDEKKLQKQVDFLESHPQHSMCFHQTMRHFENSNQPDELYYPDLEDRDYTGLEMYETCRPAEVSVVMRSDIYKSDVYKRFVDAELSFGDLPIFLTCAHCGLVYAMTDVMAVYRKHPSGLSAIFNTNSQMVLRFAEDNLKLYYIFGKQYKNICTNIYVIDYINYFLKARKEGKYMFGILMKVFLKYPILTIKSLINRFKTSKYLL